MILTLTVTESAEKFVVSTGNNGYANFKTNFRAARNVEHSCTYLFNKPL